MINPMLHRQRFGLALLFGLALPLLAQANEPLPSWNDGPAKKSIIEFVQAVTDQTSKDFVKPAERIAVFDNDGTLWSEQPAYFELLFAFDEVKRTAPQHPEWKTTQPFKAVIENDHKALAESGMAGILKIFGATHTGMTTEAFDDYAKTWLTQARHPKTGKPYTEMIFQPMLEMLDYLRSQQFKTYIVSGGDTAFMRAFAEKVYGIPPEQGDRHHIRHRVPVQGRQGHDCAHTETGPQRRWPGQTGKHRCGDRPSSDPRLRQLRRRFADAAMDGRRHRKTIHGLVHHNDAKREWRTTENLKLASWTRPSTKRIPVAGR
jgi:hypothetical protein